MKTRRRLCIAGMVLGALFLAAPVLGMIGTMFGMNRAFARLGDSGISDPHALAGEIGTVLMATSIGFLLLPLGIIVFAISLVLFLRLRATTPPPLPPEAPR